jgi:hypothetical protein
MGIFKFEGPGLLIRHSCIGCTHLSSKLFLSGRHPIYEYHCNHESVNKPPEGFPPYKEGKYIGQDSYTPSWCPMGRKNSDTKESR